jgi:hypothetical protein
MARKKGAPAEVYVMANKELGVKIGSSTSVYERRMSLQAQIKGEVHILYHEWSDYPYIAEFMCHDRMGELGKRWPGKSSRYEWFNCSYEEAIKTVKDMIPKAVLKAKEMANAIENKKIESIVARIQYEESEPVRIRAAMVEEEMEEARRIDEEMVSMFKAAADAKANIMEAYLIEENRLDSVEAMARFWGIEDDGTFEDKGYGSAAWIERAYLEEMGRRRDIEAGPPIGWEPEIILHGPDTGIPGQGWVILSWESRDKLLRHPAEWW